METTRDDFGLRQAEMTARWYENVKRAHADVDAYIATRHEAYLDRWREAARFMANGARVLDIGGGNIYPKLIELWKERGFTYAFLDVDPACVDGSRALAAEHGLAGATFGHGYNDSLPFGDAKFDAVFSSHCLEHSFDLTKTFAEVNRVLCDGGNLLMAVPFGWEENPEHPYFFGPNEWVSFVEDAGFRLRVVQIGCEYPELGYDYFIAAQKVAAPRPFRLDPRAYTKDAYTFVSPFDARLTYTGRTDRKADHVIAIDDDWTISFAVPEGANEVLPLFARHDWSGVIELGWGDCTSVEDCYSWHSYVQPLRILRGEASSAPVVTMHASGRNAASRAAQGVLYGVMVR